MYESERRNNISSIINDLTLIKLTRTGTVDEDKLVALVLVFSQRYIWY